MTDYFTYFVLLAIAINCVFIIWCTHRRMEKEVKKYTALERDIDMLIRRVESDAEFYDSQKLADRDHS